MTSVSDAEPSAPGAAPARSGLRWRLFTAAVGIPAVIVLVLLGGAPYIAAVAIALAIGYREFLRALGIWERVTGILLMVATAALAVVSPLGATAVVAVLTGAVIASLVVIIARGVVPESMAGWGLSLAGLLYVGLLGQHAVALRELPDGSAWVFLAIFTTFATDTGAYTVGRAIGRRKLAPRLSPAKTVEGAIGGLITGALAAWLLAWVLGLDHPAPALLLLGAAAAVAGQAGDLAESLIKRSIGIKDMGTLFPGHGGMLDRLDSLLFVIPLVYYASRWWLT
jgi:phosphatidate cytidylyltransferase